MDIFFQIGIMFIIATIGAYIAKLMKQPIIPVYIFAGILLGPILGLITGSDVIKTMSEIGIAFLLFIVGLELNINKLRDTGVAAIVMGVLQVILVALTGFWVAVMLGYGGIEAIYIGMILSFSSTMVVVKLLSDKGELETLHSRIVVGILLIQDVIALFALSTLITLKGISAAFILLSLAKAAALIVLAYLSSKYLFPSIFKKAAESQELLLLLSLGICFLFSILVSYIGFSIAIGAFIAGISLANLPYNIEIVGKVRSLRDFFVTLFFVSLGLGVVLSSFSRIMIPLAAFLVIVLIFKPLVLMIISALFRYTKRTSFLTAISLVQISEFSMIIAAQGLASGYVSNETFSLMVIIAVITITITSYMIKFESGIYEKFSRPLALFDVKETCENLQYLPQELKYDVVLVGYDRIGYNIFKMLTKQKKSFLVIDFNPDIIKRMISRKIQCIYGDIGDSEILNRLDLRKTELVISTVPDIKDNTFLLKKVKRENPRAIVYLTASVIEDALILYREGADYVILPYFLGGEKVSTLIEETQGDYRKVSLTKLEQINELKKRIELEHEHPRKA
ncbi:hypothetical protein COV19_00175 [Candidatus Woesearchaeota archaeon CG10_big_fil_rev_8_21_14_0_10_44_13]|nr:MAG: hypothetical protein COV19_00175 [Candidatus Woesearchaeota archaeon CG10_big_fil_rev_8_21_14_0_10_44_13]